MILSNKLRWAHRAAAALLALSLAPSAHAIDIKMGSVASSRFSTAWTLDGSQMTWTRSKLGAATDLTDGFTVAITDTDGTLTPALLSQFDIFFIGYLSDVSPNAFTSAELDSLQEWVFFGGQLLLTCDHVSYDAVCERFGYNLDANSAVNPASVVPAQANHPIFDGPYGQITNFLMWGSQGGFASSPAGADLLATSNNAPPLEVVLFERIGKGSVITLSDVDIFSNNTLSATTLFSGVGTNDNDRLLGNIIARVDALIDGDDDGVRDLADNCIGVPNPAQTDDDGDYFGAACDCDDTDFAVNPLEFEVCDGVDNDCDPGTPDGSDELWFGAPCDGVDTDLCIEGLGICTGGVRGCDDATSNDLDLCDGADNDCNPATPDGFDEPTYGQACDGGDADLCNEGILVCVGGSTMSCDDSTGDTPDSCDGTDDDCNPATPDGSGEAWFSLPCDGPDSDGCAEGAFGCVLGAQSCDDTTDDTLELCDGKNTDCDGKTPDGSDEPTLGDPCDGPDSDSCPEGFVQCTGGALACSDVTGDTLDVCDGDDNDCDPATPDGSDELWFDEACDGPDSDLCPEGTRTCTGGAQSCSDDTDNDLDVCDGADNDCDPTSADGAEDPLVGVDCDGPGDSDACEEAISTCAAGVVVCDDTGDDDVDVCDGVDNDCDPTTPDGSGEAWFGASCASDGGAGCANGFLQCSGGAASCTVSAETFYLDADGDGCGDPDTPVVSCAVDRPADAVANADDPDDTDGECCGNGVVEGTEECDPGPPSLVADGGAPDGGGGANGRVDAGIADDCTDTCMLPPGADAGAGGGGGVGAAGGVGGTQAAAGVAGSTLAGAGGAAGFAGDTVSGGSPTGTDAGLMGPSDDAGTGGAAAEDASGCGCRIGPRSERETTGFLLALLALSWVARRRRAEGRKS